MTWSIRGLFKYRHTKIPTQLVTKLNVKCVALMHKLQGHNSCTVTKLTWHFINIFIKNRQTKLLPSCYRMPFLIRQAHSHTELRKVIVQISYKSRSNMLKTISLKGTHYGSVAEVRADLRMRRHQSGPLTAGHCAEKTECLQQWCRSQIVIKCAMADWLPLWLATTPHCRYSSCRSLGSWLAQLQTDHSQRASVVTYFNRCRQINTEALVLNKSCACKY